MHVRSAVVSTLLLAGFIVLPMGAAQASPSNSFGEHVRTCAQAGHLSASQNPGMHRGAAGWDGMPCH